MALAAVLLWCCAGGMFVSDEVRVKASFEAAARRLSDLADGAGLDRASHGAWGEGIARVGPVGPLPGLSKLVHVQFRELARRGGVAVLTIRWQATGPAGGLFPVLDADITLAPHGENAALLGIDGVYGPPAGAIGAAMDRALLRRIATATVRSFLSRLADAIADPVPDPAGSHAHVGPDRRNPGP